MTALWIRKVIMLYNVLNASPVHQLSVSVVKSLINSFGWKCKSVDLKLLMNKSNHKRCLIPGAGGCGRREGEDPLGNNPSGSLDRGHMSPLD